MCITGSLSCTPKTNTTFRINCAGRCVFSCVHLFRTPWTGAHQAPLSSDFPGKNAGVGCHTLLQGIFPTQGSNPGLLCLLHGHVDSLPFELPSEELGLINCINYVKKVSGSVVSNSLQLFVTRQAPLSMEFSR